ncbi:MAG TPA: NAD(P)H-dependent oxidoreductase [Candidatus Binatia bacterium]|nr:NAD(P)H-dependent oxidoreductase [Candidatus Binatia bacterium]
MKLLRIDSSARRNSISRQLTGKFVETWRSEHPAGEVIHRDLAATHFPLITDEWTQASYSNPATRTPEQAREIALSEELIEEVSQADAIVIGAPMYNLTVSTLLKAWIDQVVRMGRTVHHGPEGLKGVFTGKKVYVLTARGGSFAQGTATAVYDHQEPYLRHILALVGLTDVTFIHAENQKPGDLAEPSRLAALAAIHQEAASIAATAGQ